MTRYMDWLRVTRGLPFSRYDELWTWSVTDLEAFWASIWDFFQVHSHRPYRRVLSGRTMPGARWFEGAELNYAEHVFLRRRSGPAVIAHAEGRPSRTVSYDELHRQVASVAAGLRRLGVGRGDRVVAYIPNILEAVVAFLATASLGAIWSSCPPEFGIQSVVDRFQQIEPKVLIAADGYTYGGRAYPRLEEIAQLRAQLPTVEHVVLVPHLDPSGHGFVPSDRKQGPDTGRAVPWRDLLGISAPWEPEPVPFDHPLWILFSSGTTGLPKAIVQGHGGILLEHLKALSLHLDLKAEERFFWFTTTGWMMWNFLVSGLLIGTTIVLYDGSPAYPDLGALWRLAAQERINYFGTSAPFILSCMRAGLRPGRDLDLSALHGIGSTGSPLTPDGFQWVYDAVGGDVLLGSISGGTDMCTAIVLSCPLEPVVAGEIQCRGLGAKVESYGEDGRPHIGRVGELVITEPLPSMPLYFWNDPEGAAYRSSYFHMYPGVWRHGDWIEITERGSCVIYGRSDATLKRAGIRVGTSEFYRVVESLPEVRDSLVVDTGGLHHEGKLVLFVALQPGHGALTEELAARIRHACRHHLSPRHVPDEIYSVPDIPRTLNGKKMEVPIKRLLTGTPVDKAVARDAMANPDSLDPFIELARGNRDRQTAGEP